MSEPQTYANHRRFAPFRTSPLSPLFLVTFGTTIGHLIKSPGLPSAWVMVLAFAVLALAVQVRVYSLKVQDRLIRLEETLRMERILPEDLKPRIVQLSVKQMVGLRFAADAELADRVREALDQNLGGEAIKKHIKTWRPDTFRV